ncbi:MAG: hypothetical protein RL398_509 [Planctomycetota bacterium]
MNRIRSFSCIAFCLTSACVFDSTRRPLVDVNGTVAGKYVFRGQTFTQKPVAQVDSRLQLPTKGDGRAVLATFANLDLRDDIGTAWGADGNGGDFTQVDFVGGYAKSFGNVAAEAGVRHYQWADGDDFRFAPFPSTTEVYAQLGLEVLGGTATVSAHRDVDEADSLYLRGRFDRAFALGEDWSLEVGGWLGWSDANHSQWLYRTDSAGFADLGGSVQVAWTLDELTTARLGVHGSTIVDDDFRDWFGPRIDADVVWLTASIGWSF